MTIFKIQSKRTLTNEEGIFYKRIINDNGKEIDKIYLIRSRNNDKDRLKTIGKYSQGIRINYCKQIRNEILMKLRLGEDPPVIVKIGAIYINMTLRKIHRYILCLFFSIEKRRNYNFKSRKIE
ncbi:MAG: hypothetical protein WBF48_12835 [Halarcobacter sp.]